MQTKNLIPNRVTGSVIAAVLVSIATLAHGQGIPPLINYQGRLTDTLGNPVASGYYEIQFRLWDDGLQNGAGNLVWARSFPLHVVTNGVFNVLLSDAGGTVTTPAQPTATLLEAFNGPDRYLGLTITLSNGVSVAGSEISPRQQLASAPFAVHAQTASATLINAVGSDAIQNASVVTAKIANNAVTTAQLANGAVTSAKLAPNVALTDRSNQIFTGNNRFNNNVAIGVPGTGQGQRAVTELWSTFTNVSGDTGPRRTADVIAGFSTGGWGTEFLSLSVGNNGSSNDDGEQTSEKVRVQANGNVGIGTSTPASKLHVNGSVTIEEGPVSMFGALQTMAKNVPHTATTDGFIIVAALNRFLNYRIWPVGAWTNSTPTIDQTEYHNVAGANTFTMAMPVAKGETWQLDDKNNFGGTNTYLNISWRPLGK